MPTKPPILLPHETPKWLKSLKPQVQKYKNPFQDLCYCLHSKHLIYNIAPKKPASPTIIPPAPIMISLLAPFFPVALAAAAELAVLLAVLTAPPSVVVCALPLPPVVVAKVVCAATSEDTGLEMALVAAEV
jgi:hypothetical protein